MTTFRLELRVFENNPIRWQVFLESVNEANMISHWIPPGEGRAYYSKQWDAYKINDNALEVFVSCTGFGASVKCNVLINNENPNNRNTIVSNFDDSRPAVKSFPV